LPVAESAAGKPGFVVFRRLDCGCWELVGEAARRPGLTARKARAQAVRDAAGREPSSGEHYAAVLRSEWRIALDH
jgi:hypothetical protein